MKQLQTQIKKKPSYKKRRSNFLTCNLKRFTHYFFTKELFYLTKNVIIENNYPGKRKNKKEKKHLSFLNTLIFVFTLLINQKLINFFWIRNKKKINKAQKFQKNMNLFIETYNLIFPSKISSGTK